MNKGQSLVVQFVIFFLIGFTLFISTGSIFKYQSDMFRERNIESSLNLSNSYLSSVIISAIDSCKECDFVSITTKMQNMTAGYILEFELTKASGLNVSIPQIKKYSNSTVHNLIFSLNSSSGKSGSTEPLTLTFNKNQNNLGVK
jgi:hypothetical protein